MNIEQRPFCQINGDTTIRIEDAFPHHVDLTRVKLDRSEEFPREI